MSSQRAIRSPFSVKALNRSFVENWQETPSGRDDFQENFVHLVNVMNDPNKSQDKIDFYLEELRLGLSPEAVRTLVNYYTAQRKELLSQSREVFEESPTIQALRKILPSLMEIVELHYPLEANDLMNLASSEKVNPFYPPAEADPEKRLSMAEREAQRRISESGHSHHAKKCYNKRCFALRIPGDTKPLMAVYVAFTKQPEKQGHVPDDKLPGNIREFLDTDVEMIEMPNTATAYSVSNFRDDRTRGIPFGDAFIMGVRRALTQNGYHKDIHAIESLKRFCTLSPVQEERFVIAPPLTPEQEAERDEMDPFEVLTLDHSAAFHGWLQRQLNNPDAMLLTKAESRLVSNLAGKLLTGDLAGEQIQPLLQTTVVGKITPHSDIATDMQTLLYARMPYPHDSKEYDKHNVPPHLHPLLNISAGGKEEIEAFQQLLDDLLLMYLFHAKNERGGMLNEAGDFHCCKGAYIAGFHRMGNNTRASQIMGNQYMVNYAYTPHSESDVKPAYVNEHTIAASKPLVDRYKQRMKQLYRDKNGRNMPDLNIVDVHDLTPDIEGPVAVWSLEGKGTVRKSGSKKR